MSGIIKTINFENNTKRCCKCNLWQDFSFFYKDKSNSHGLNSTCKSCCKIIRNSEKTKQYFKEFQKTEHYKEYHKNYDKSEKRQLSRERTNLEKRRKREKRYRLNNPLYKLKQNCSRRIRESLNNKKDKTIEYLGCSIIELKLHLEKQFKPEMSWSNYGNWEIDHIIPLCSAKTEEELIKLFHYTNLQPLWSHENRTKGGKYEN